MNVAARIQALAAPGGIYISRGAAEEVPDKVPIKLERPIEVFCTIAEDRNAITVAVREPSTGRAPPKRRRNIVIVS